MRRLRRFYWQHIRRYRWEMCSCGRPVGLVWTADDTLFEQINGSPYGCLCIPCFDAMCTARDVYLRWVPRPLMGSEANVQRVPPPPGISEEEWRTMPVGLKATSSRAVLEDAPEESRWTACLSSVGSAVISRRSRTAEASSSGAATSSATGPANAHKRHTRSSSYRPDGL